MQICVGMRATRPTEVSMIPNGYKKTEIGVIPLDWEVNTIENITTYVDYRGKTPKKIKRGIFLVTARNIKNNIINYSLSSEYIAEEDYETVMSRGKPKLGDVLLTTEAPLGEIASIDNENIALAQRIIKYRAIEKYLDNSFLKHYFTSSKFQDVLLLNATGSTVKGIKGSRLKKLKIPLPPLTQQKKIAQILSTADEKIEAIALQIEKAEMVKKGLMQRLLSDESWEIKTLDSVATITMGQSPKSSTYNQENIGIPLIQGNADCKNRKTVPRTYTTELTKECFVGDIIMTVRAPVGAISKSLHNACIGRGVCSIKPNEENEFLYHFLVNYEDKWDKLSQGSTFTAVSGSDIRSIKLFFPPLKEQTKIANILTTADEKLEVLRAKKAKYEELKVGLMQKLLTGEVRV